MTREEIIESLEAYIPWADEYEINIEVLRRAVELLKQEPKWIPVSERLPEVGTCVLTSIIPEVSNYRVIISKFNNEEWWADGTVEAWQPLPEPYKADPQGSEG